MHVNKKIALFVVAENNSGKTSLAHLSVKTIENMGHYSIRETIEEIFEGDTKQKISADRQYLQNYSEKMKLEHDAEIFIRHTIEKFNQSTFDVAIIESVRAPGEAEWIQGKEFEKEFPNIIPLIIGVTAPIEHRLRRFLSDRPDNIAATLTEEEFYIHEAIANHGKEPHEENIGVTMLYTNLTVDNADGRLHEVVEEIRALIASLQNAA